MTDPPPAFDPRPMAPKPLLEGPLAALLEWQAMAEGAYSPNTLRVSLIGTLEPHGDRHKGASVGSA